MRASAKKIYAESSETLAASAAEIKSEFCRVRKGARGFFFVLDPAMSKSLGFLDFRLCIFYGIVMWKVIQNLIGLLICIQI